MRGSSSLWVVPETTQPQQTHLLLVLQSSLPLALMAGGSWWLLAVELFTPFDFSVILHVQPGLSPTRDMTKEGHRGLSYPYGAGELEVSRARIEAGPSWLC